MGRFGEDHFLNFFQKFGVQSRIASIRLKLTFDSFHWEILLVLLVKSQFPDMFSIDGKLTSSFNSSSFSGWKGLARWIYVMSTLDWTRLRCSVKGYDLRNYL